MSETVLVQPKDLRVFERERTKLLDEFIAEKGKAAEVSDRDRLNWVYAKAVQARVQNAKMFKLIRDFVLCETSQTSYEELKGSQSMDIPVEFLALCEFAEEMGVKLS
jgi:hypothetical protein